MPQGPKGAKWGLKNLFGRPTYLPPKKKKKGSGCLPAILLLPFTILLRSGRRG